MAVSKHAVYWITSWTIGLAMCSALAGCGDSIGMAEVDDAVYLEIAGDQVEVYAESPAEEAFLTVGMPFLEAIVQGDHASAYSMLSRHARGRMSQNQFDQLDDEAATKRREENPHWDVSADQFSTLLNDCFLLRGTPHGVQDYWVQETDQETLSGAGHPLDVMFSIGAMPKSFPISTRRAALRASISTEFKPGDVARLADEFEISQDEVLQDETLRPYFNLKFVLVEEDATLKVGYFEFLPPSLFD